MAAPPIGPAPSQSTAAAALAETADGTPALAHGLVSVQATTPHRIGRFIILRLLGQGDPLLHRGLGSSDPIPLHFPVAGRWRLPTAGVCLLCNLEPLG